MEEAKQKQKGQDQENLNESEENWSEHVENLLESGDIDGAISFLESAVASFSANNDLQLAAAMSDLADLYSSRGFSMKSDELKSRALSIRARLERDLPSQTVSDNPRDLNLTNIVPEEKDTEGNKVLTTSKEVAENDEDDWEAIADLEETDAQFLSLQPEIKTTNLNNLMKKDKVNLEKTKRRGRGSFLYNKSMLYSDTQDLEKLEINHAEEVSKDEEGANRVEFGTGHVLVLYDFPTSTRTTELEIFFEAFNERGVAIRWVNDTCALAVFRTSSLAEEAKNDVPTRYKVRFLSDDDEILTQLKSKDLEPPYPRPKTSARTAQRMIAQSMGLRIKSSNSSVHEHKSLERERKNRIVTRQALRDEAWGPD